ncbi:MAG: hypothetical protein ABJA81_07000 [Nocardioidaceae bacterium]
MKINRMAVVIASTFLALFAAAGVAAATGGGNAHNPSGKASPSQVGTLTPWHHTQPVTVIYRPHMICEEFNHDVLKDRRS